MTLSAVNVSVNLGLLVVLVMSARPVTMAIPIVSLACVVWRERFEMQAMVIKLLVIP